MIIKEIMTFDHKVCGDGPVDVVITDGIYELICFTDAHELYEGQKLKKSLSVYTRTYTCCNLCTVKYMKHIFAGYDADVLRAEEEIVIRKLSGIYEYHITGKLVDKKEGIVSVNSIYMFIDASIPKDIKDGELITFHSNRIDVLG